MVNLSGILLLLISSISGKIQGIVIDDFTNEPIPYASVIIQETEVGTSTDQDGTFFILNVLPGIYTVEISCVGYQSQYIRDVIVEIDQTARLNVVLTQAPVEMEPITVVSETPYIEKDMTGTTYILRKPEIATLPIDYTISLITFQPAVAQTDTSIHVRGGRATEVLYLIDNVSIIDPQTGDPAITLSKGIIDEIVFMPGGFDAEYGRAMSGVINLVTERPADRFRGKILAKTETIMPFYYDFGYQNYQSSIHMPVSKNLRGFFSFDLMHTDDWDPRLYILPHKQRDDYSMYGKWVFSPSGRFNIALSGVQSRSQFDRYYEQHTFYKFHLDHYRSDMRKGNLQVLDISYLPDTRYLFNITLSRLFTRRIYGVREQDDYGPFEDFVFRDYNTLEWPLGTNDNPFGIAFPSIICSGDYPKYEDKSSHVIKTDIKSTLQLHKYHEINAGLEYVYQTLENFTYFLSNDTTHRITDEYQYQPLEYSFYLQDNVDYKGLYAKVGCRYDYFDSDIQGYDPKIMISPRIGFSFMVTDRFLFRANIGRYAQPPLYDYMYGNYSLLPLPSYLYKYYPVIGNPDLAPEKTMSYEIGLQGEIRKNLSTTVNAFYKDVSDLTGSRILSVSDNLYLQHFNVEYANIKGIETILEFSNHIFIGKISYTLSWTKGTSSYARELYDRIQYDPDYVPQLQEYYLDFDQRHRIFVQGIVKLPYQTSVYLFGHIGQGFPYTPPGPEGKYDERNISRLSFQKRIDCVISKSFTIGKFSLNANFEIINILDARYEVTSHFPQVTTEIHMEDFEHGPPYIDVHNAYYRPAADLNHNGLVTPNEEFLSFKRLIDATDDWVNANSAPRRARIGINLYFN